MPTNHDDVLFVPAITGEELNGHRVNVEWQQSFSNRSAAYYVLIAQNRNQSKCFLVLPVKSRSYGVGAAVADNAEVTFFIAEEWYSGSASAPQHISKVGRVVNGGYEVTITDVFQYGQKNKAGDGRFVVYHDHSRKPFQHRFVSSIGSTAAGVAQKIAGLFGYASVADIVANAAKAFIGDYLHNF
ncbi:hypothetical protein BC834DRAFT_847282 [Gloeopeniophorella convolvens]|nr:hypothetical protein BC834DRAFT_847282 [Gloeopeniophorella convolvens]